METQIIHQGVTTTLSIIDHKKYGKVVMKSLNEEFPSPKKLLHFLHEYKFCKELNIKGVRKVIDWKKDKQSHHLFLEYIEGISLSEYKQTQPGLREILTVFSSIARVLSELHQHGIIHNRISPENIIIKTDTLSATVIDFTESTKYSLRSAHMVNPSLLNGDVHYMAPEQTGRVNRIIDHRSDLYALGIMLYEFLTGAVPFKSKDLIELVHAQIAVEPQPLKEKNPDCPDVLCRIVHKLLQKNADARYQSANGVKIDLENCLNQLKHNQSISPFALAQIDISPRFELSQKLYGRDKELKKLMHVFDKSAGGETHLMLISGYSGTGKSVLVSEIYKPITSKKGYFIQGKFDQYQKSIPYYAILKAFNALIHILLTESSSLLQSMKIKMLEALGQEGKVLTDVLPSLELIIGKQSAVADINGEDAQNRFNYVFQKWLSAICSEQHPIVLFIDDLQWADSASLDLLENIMLKRDNYFFCIGAYRDNEVNSAHPLSITIKDLEDQKARIEKIHLENLSLNNIKDLLSDSLSSTKSDIEDLAELIYQKTRGNAFFVVQFIKSLTEKSLLKFNTKSGIWDFDVQKIHLLNITDNVVEFMAEKIKEFPRQTQELLQVASCLGTFFSFERLEHASKIDKHIITIELDFLLQEGLILKLEDDFKFTHDRIQQAVYSLINEQDRNRLHFKIGKYLLSQTTAEKLDEQIFDITNHINWGAVLIESEDERLEICNLNLKASRKAKLTSAYKEAFQYIKNAIDLLPENPWQTDYKLTLNIFEEASESAFLAGQFGEMHAYIDLILDNTNDLFSRVKPYEIRINAYKAENQLKEALEAGLDILAQLGEKFPKKPSQLTVFPDLIKTFLKLRGKEAKDILALPKTEDPKKIASLRILANIAPSSYWGNPTIFPHIIFRMCQISLKSGVSAPSAFGFATYGVIMIGVLNKIKTGYPFGQIGLQLINRFNAKEWIAQVYTPVYALINIWNGHIKHTLSPLLDSYQIGLETGALEFSCINANIYCIHAYVIGKPLDKLEPEIKDYSTIINQYKQETNYMYNEVFRQSALNFMGKAKDNLKLIGDAFNDEKLLHEGIEKNNRTVSFMIFFHRSILGNYFGDADYALENALKSEELLDAVLGKIEVALQAFHIGLAAAYAKDSKFGSAQKHLNNSIKKMKVWAKHAPENFQHKLYLLKAEKYRLEGQLNKAREYYDLSINAAQENDYIQETALANELAAKFHHTNKNFILAKFYLRNTYQAYRDWGATAKLIQLVKNHPDELKGLLDESLLSEEVLSTAKDLSLSYLDLQSIFKVSTTLSGEVVFEKMLNKLMHIISENIGANKAALILAQENDLVLKAHWTVEKNKMKIENTLFEDISFLPKSIIYYIERTKKQVLLGSASQDQRFGKDQYIQDTKAKSVLGLPLINKNNLLGILYLENTLLDNAFNTKNIKILNLLSNQIAISIDNAILYENLENKVLDRTSELADEKKKSDDLLLNILPAETALELKKYGKARPRKYESVSVIFTDFVNFTKNSEELTPGELVVRIDEYFTKFDEISQKYNIEKIKTIGDAYLCVSGLPLVDENHAVNAVNAAFEMRDFVLKQAQARAPGDPKAFKVRVGIHSGSVVSGVVGFKKFAFDIWGDTVNTASRIENNSEPFKINISDSTYELVKDHFDCKHRGRIEAKNKGKINMYFIEPKK